MKTKLLFTALTLFLTIALVSAQGPTNCKGKCKGTEKKTAVVQGDKKNLTAQCNGTVQGKEKGQGKNFVDANKNGVCDRYEATVKK